MPAPRLADLTAQMLDAAVRAGADAADALAVDGTSLTIDVRAGALEHAERSEGIDLGLRVLVGRRQACVSASDTGGAAITGMAERAVAMARAAPEDPHAGLARADQLASDRDAGSLDLLDPAPEPAPQTLQEEAARTEAAALAVEGVSQTQGATAGYGRRCIHLAATNGFSGGYARTSRSLSCVAISGEGTAMERDYHGETRIYHSDLPPAEEIGRLAGERAAARAGPLKPPTGRFPVIFDERVAASLIGHLVQAVSGTAVARGASWLLGAEGEAVLPPDLSLIENPHRRRISGSRPFDAEGLPTAARAIIEQGRLTGWTLDLATGRKLGRDSTGNASRGTSSPPSPSVTNLELTEGALSWNALIAETGEGLLVTSLIGASINPTTGDYSRGASGFWVTGGEISHPVNECTIAGNLRDMLKTLTPANDARRHLSRVVPSCRVEGLTIAGA